MNKPKDTQDSNLHKKLDELALRPRITRKISTDITDETPIWNEYEGLWMKVMNNSERESKI